MQKLDVMWPTFALFQLYMDATIATRLWPY